MTKPIVPDEPSSEEQFIDMVNHELKSPLATIKISAEILQKRNQQGQDLHFSESIEKINSRVDYLASLINDYTDLIRIQSELLNFKDEICVFSELVYESTCDFNFKFKRLKFEKYGITKYKVSVDKERFRQVILSLVKYIEKISDACKKISLYSKSKGDFLIINLRSSNNKDKKREAGIFEPGKLTSYQSKLWKEKTELRITPVFAAEIFKHCGGKFSVLYNKKAEIICCFTLPLIS